jgi:dGTPase
MRQRLEKAEDRQLAPYAWRSAEASRRSPVEDAGRVFEYRTAFQRDRDRILYSRAFRRLRQKALAGILPAYEDHRRNRLTHTLEVAQLARTIGRALRLNEDLVEAIALGHDLGQPPFGPAGERALDDLLSGRLDDRGGPGLGDLGGFWCGWQALRVVDDLEKRYERNGLNLTDQVREGILKCSRSGRTPPQPFDGVRVGQAPPFEVQVAAIADRVASALSDLDDALQSGAVSVPEVERLAAVTELRKKLGRGWRPRLGRFMKANVIHRGLIHLMVTGIVHSSQRSLARWVRANKVRGIASFRAVRDQAIRGTEVGPSTNGHRMLEDIEGYLESRVRRGYDADRVEARCRRVLTGLFMAYRADPTLLDDHVLLRYKQMSGVRFLRDLPRDAIETELDTRYRDAAPFLRLLADHLAAMTDAYALEEHAKLMQIGAVPIPSAEQLKRET